MQEQVVVNEMRAADFKERLEDELHRSDEIAERYRAAQKELAELREAARMWVPDTKAMIAAEWFSREMTNQCNRFLAAMGETP